MTNCILLLLWWYICIHVCNLINVLCSLNGWCMYWEIWAIQNLQISDGIIPYSMNYYHVLKSRIKPWNYEPILRDWIKQENILFSPQKWERPLGNKCKCVPLYRGHSLAFFWQVPAGGWQVTVYHHLSPSDTPSMCSWISLMSYWAFWLISELL